MRVLRKLRCYIFGKAASCAIQNILAGCPFQRVPEIILWMTMSDKCQRIDVGGRAGIKLSDKGIIHIEDAMNFRQQRAKKIVDIIAVMSRQKFEYLVNRGPGCLLHRHVPYENLMHVSFSADLTLP
tara:strand:- start:62 stop:439 length:378 start_codon:yes stop_codon:yes gene_type:complete